MWLFEDFKRSIINSGLSIAISGRDMLLIVAHFLPTSFAASPHLVRSESELGAS